MNEKNKNTLIIAVTAVLILIIFSVTAVIIVSITKDNKPEEISQVTEADYPIQNDSEGEPDDEFDSDEEENSAATKNKTQNPTKKSPSFKVTTKKKTTEKKTTTKNAEKLTDSTAKNLYNKANKVYTTWTTNTGVHKLADPSDKITLPGSYGDTEYWKVKHDSINSVSELDTYLKGYFGADEREVITGQYIDYNSQLYYDSSCAYFIEGSGENKVSLKSQSGDTAVLSIGCFDSMTQAYLYNDINLSRVGGTWIFDTFIPAFEPYVPPEKPDIPDVPDVPDVPDEPDKTYDYDELSEIVISTLQPSETEGDLVINDDEISEDESNIYMTVRIQRYDATMYTGSNLLYADIRVDKATGNIYMDDEIIATA